MPNQSMPVFAAIIYINNTLTTVIGVIANIAALFLAFLVRDSSTRDVRVSIVAHAITDLSLTVVYSALQLGVVILDGSAVFLIIGPITQVAVWIPRGLFAVFCLLFEVDILLLPIGFLYRYAIICRKDRLMKMFTVRYFMPFCIVVWTILLGFDAVLQPFLVFQRNKVHSGGYKDLGDPIFISMEPDRGTALICYCIFLSMTAILSYVIIIFCAQGTFKMLSSAKVVSDRTRKLQREVTIGMILQAVLPLGFSTLPMLCLVALVLSPIQIDCYGSLFFALLYWQPCVHPLLSLYFVRPFRDAIIRRTTFKKAIPLHTATTLVKGEVFKNSVCPSRTQR